MTKWSYKKSKNNKNEQDIKERLLFGHNEYGLCTIKKLLTNQEFFGLSFHLGQAFSFLITFRAEPSLNQPICASL